MSIALTLVLRPSRVLQISAIFFSILLIAIAVQIGCNESIAIYLRIGAALFCLSLSLVNILHASAIGTKGWHISISGQGEIRCQMKKNLSDSKKNHQIQPYRLVAGTTIWPKMLFLRLRSVDSDDKINLVIPSDALDKDEFRRLSIACRWIVKHAK